MNDIISKPKIDERVLNSFVYKNSIPSIDVYETFQHYIGDCNNGIICTVTKKDIYEWEKVFYKRLKNYIPSNVNCFIAGGSVLTYILYGNELLIRDYDIFVPDKETFDIIDAHLTSLKGKDDFQNDHTKHFSFGHIEIDLIKQTFPTMTTLFNQFDIDLCRVGFEVTTNQNFFFKKEPSFKRIFLRILKMPNLHQIDFKADGIKLLKRLLKYSAKGFKIEYNTLMQFYSSSLMAFSDKQTVSEKESLRFDILSDLENQVKKDYQFSDADINDVNKGFVSDIFCDTSVKIPTTTTWKSVS